MSAVIDNERFRKLLRSYPAGAIKLLFDLYYKNLLKVAWHFTHDENASKDIVQDTFLHVWEKRNQLAQEQDRLIEHYLVRVVRNKSISHYKKKKHLSLDNKQINYLLTIASSESSFETTMIEKELILQVRQLILTFPKKERECLLMQIDQSMTIDQIAEQSKVTRKAVERSLTSAKKRLRKWGSGK